MQIAIIEGRRHCFVETGDPASRRTLVLLHAFPMGMGLFEPQYAAFAGWRLIVPALPGFDGSDLLERPTADEYARHVATLLDELHVERAVVGGVSLGGYLTFGLLRQAPARVAAAILADTRSAADSDEARGGRDRMLRIVRESGPSGVAAEMLPKLFGGASQRTRPELVARVRRMIEAQTADGIAAAVHVLKSRPDSTPLLSGLHIPTLVIVGAGDVLTPPAEMRGMAEAIPNATFVEVDGAGHIPNFEVPETFNREVRQFLARLPPNPGT